MIKINLLPMLMPSTNLSLTARSTDFSVFFAASVGVAFCRRTAVVNDARGAVEKVMLAAVREAIAARREVASMRKDMLDIVDNIYAFVVGFRVEWNGSSFFFSSSLFICKFDFKD